MKLVDRQLVEATVPKVYIGHRTYVDRRTGQPRISRTWYAEYCVDGRQRFKALDGTTNKTAAVRAAHALCQQVASSEDGDAPRQDLTLEALARDYLHLQTNRGRAPKTVEKYELVVRNLLEWAQNHGPVLARRFDERAYWRFKAAMAKAGLADKTQYDRLVVVRQIFKWGFRSRLLPRNPLAGISMKKPSPELQPCFSPKQIGQLLEAAEPWLKPIVALMAYTGMRFGEVRDLRWSDLLLDQGPHGMVLVRRGGSDGQTKNKSMRRIPIHAELRPILDALPRVDDRVFVAPPSGHNPDGGGPLKERRLLNALKRLCRICEFPDADQYKLHTFRHAFASMCARQSISYRYALSWMGHSSSAILDLYVTTFDETAINAIASLRYPLASPEKPTKLDGD